MSDSAPPASVVRIHGVDKQFTAGAGAVTALKISATASIVGAIVGEGPGGIPDGLGRAIINFNSQYVTGPEKLWAAILACAVVGILFFTLVRAAELLTLRGRGIRPEVA